MYFIQRIYVAVSFERICIFIFLLLSLGSNNNNLKKLAPSLLNLPYAKETTDRIGRILNIHNIKTIFKPPKKIAQILKNSKDLHSTSQEYIKYLVPAGKYTLEYIRRMVNLRIKEHQREVKLKHAVSIITTLKH